jgi:hypothetical protein
MCRRTNGQPWFREEGGVCMAVVFRRERDVARWVEASFASAESGGNFALTLVEGSLHVPDFFQPLPGVGGP